jgi:hypothetical protein
MPDFPKPPGGGATAAEVWSYATRQLSADGANVVRDAILSDAQKIAGANIDAAISGRAPAGEYDTELDAAISSRASGAEYTATRAAKIDKVQDFQEEATGTLSATGAEDIIKEIADTVNKLHCFVDLTNMQAGDSVTVRQYMKIKSGGSYILYAEETYSGVQTLPMLYIVTKPARYGIKITLEQTAGTNRDYDWETFTEQAA